MGFNPAEVDLVELADAVPYVDSLEGEGGGKLEGGNGLEGTVGVGIEGNCFVA